MGFRIASTVGTVVQRSDIDGDGIVESDDLSAVLGSYGCDTGMPTECQADINYDGIVDDGDLVKVLSHFGDTVK